MKSYISPLVVICCLTIVCGACSQAQNESSAKPEVAQNAEKQELKWTTDFEAASAEAKQTGKYMLLDFSGSDWCSWCLKLDAEVFQKKAFYDYATENLVCVLLDFPRGKSQPEELKAQNNKLMKRYSVRGFPTVVILNPDAELVDITGYRRGGAQKYVDYLKGVIADYKSKNAASSE